MCVDFIPIAEYQIILSFQRTKWQSIVPVRSGRSACMYSIWGTMLTEYRIKWYSRWVRVSECIFFSRRVLNDIQSHSISCYKGTFLQQSSMKMSWLTQNKDQVFLPSFWFHVTAEVTVCKKLAKHVLYLSWVERQGYTKIYKTLDVPWNKKLAIIGKWKTWSSTITPHQDILS